MRFHLAALPGQPVGGPEANPTCAFTEKVRKFGPMMEPLGHEVTVYGDPRGEGVGCYREVSPPPFTPDGWREFNLAAALEIEKRAEPGDILGLMGGTAQQLLADCLPHLTPVEYGIGYGGSIPTVHRVFESMAWMHATYGAQQGNDSADGNFFDDVIPAYFEPERFPEGEDGGYLLYVGRLTQRKGVHIVTETAKRLGLPLKIAGAGDVAPDYGEQLGVVYPEERGDLMANATALMCPTVYVEPFGCIAVEAQLCGTPVISTDWGAFTETVEQGFSGWRCRTLGEFMWAVENVGRLDRAAIRRRAQETWSLEAIGARYDIYFRRLASLRGDGWYDESRRCPVPDQIVTA